MVSIEPLSFLFEGRKDLVIAEIGIEQCYSTLYMLNNFDIKRYYAIDPFKAYPEFNPSFVKNYFQNDPDKYCERAKKILVKYNNVVFMRMFSSKAVEYVKDGELDVVWIDGNHSYKYVFEDIVNWFPKVKVGGYISGDDSFNMEVMMAVRTCFTLKKFDVFVGKRSWCVKKLEGSEIEGVINT